jgi:hypothetical protein
MKLIQANLKTPKTDIWGFKLIWVPVGKEGDIVDESGNVTKVIKLSDILNQQSLSTLAGIPIYLYHPNDGAVDPENFGDFEAVGACTDKYRLVEGGVEVQARITKQLLYPFLEQQKITHVSPCYTEDTGYRSYNHIALLPPGWAKGGDKMFISLEGIKQPQTSQVDNEGGIKQPLIKEETKPTPINKQVTDYRFTGVNLPRESYLLPIDTETSKNKIYMNIEELLGQLLAGQAAMCESLSTLAASMKAEEAAEVEGCSTDMESATAMEESKMAAYSEGFAAGKEAGKILSTAVSHGFDSAKTDVDEASKYVISKAFPNLSVEGFSPSVLSGVYQGALESLKVVKEVAKVTVEVESNSTATEATPAPTIVEKAPVSTGATKRMKISPN